MPLNLALIDDSKYDRRIKAVFIEDCFPNFECLIDTFPAEFDDLAGYGKYDGVITDYDLCGKRPGVELADAIRAAHEGLPVAIYTGLMPQAAVLWGVRERGITVLHKDDGPETIADMREFLMRCKARRERK